MLYLNNISVLVLPNMYFVLFSSFRWSDNSSVTQMIHSIDHLIKTVDKHHYAIMPVEKPRSTQLAEFSPRFFQLKVRRLFIKTFLLFYFCFRCFVVGSINASTSTDIASKVRDHIRDFYIYLYILIYISTSPSSSVIVLHSIKKIERLNEESLTIVASGLKWLGRSEI